MENKALLSLLCRGIIVYLKYKSICPIVRIGSPLPPRLQESLSPPLEPKEGEQHFLAGEGVGGPNADDRIESLHCLKSSKLYFWW
jgi:hypothetical protein